MLSTNSKSTKDRVNISTKDTPNPNPIQPKPKPTIKIPSKKIYKQQPTLPFQTIPITSNTKKSSLAYIINFDNHPHQTKGNHLFIFPKITKSTLIITTLKLKMSRAALKRSFILQQRVYVLRMRAEKIRALVYLAGQKEKARRQRLEAIVEKKFYAGSLRRQMHLNIRSLRCMMLTKRVLNISLLANKSKVGTKHSVARKSLSDDNYDDEYFSEQDFKIRIPSPTNSLDSNTTINPDPDIQDTPFNQTPTCKPSTSSPSPTRTKPKSQIKIETMGSHAKQTGKLDPRIYELLSPKTHAFEFTTLLPQITRSTLQELDVDEILLNPQLRHDLYFDPNLQFKPNLEGERGITKRRLTEAYWGEVEREVCEFGLVYRIPLLLFEIKNILVDLIPVTTREEKDGFLRDLDAVFDVCFVMQELEYGVFDPLGLMGYVSGLLKKNCAPARDEVIDVMINQAENGNFVACLKTCFEVLEMMKLDYANHQLLRLRSFVIENAQSFELRYFKSLNLKLTKTSIWLQNSYLELKTKTSPNAKFLLTRTPSLSSSSSGIENLPNPLLNFKTVYSNALLCLIASSQTLLTDDNNNNADKVPETLQLDLNRLIQFYNDWQDITIMSSLVVIFKQFCRHKESSSSSKLNKEVIKKLKLSMWILLNDNETSISHITIELAEQIANTRNVKFGDDEMKAFSVLVERTVSGATAETSGAVFKVMQGRVGFLLLDMMVKGKKIDKGLAEKFGFEEFLEEVGDLGERVCKVLQLNCWVYSDFHVGIWEGLL